MSAADSTTPEPPSTAPVLETERLRLRPFELVDAPEIQRLAGDFDVARTTARIPHPYEDGMAEAWIAGQARSAADGGEIHWAVTRRADGALLGAIGLTPAFEHRRGELGYWIGRPFWRNGYATEAAREVVRYGFETLRLERIHAGAFAGNVASARVLKKLGMQHEGRRRRHFLRFGQFQDVELYALLREESESSDRSSTPPAS